MKPSWRRSFDLEHYRDWLPVADGARPNRAKDRSNPYLDYLDHEQPEPVVHAEQYAVLVGDTFYTYEVEIKEQRAMRKWLAVEHQQVFCWRWPSCSCGFLSMRWIDDCHNFDVAPDVIAGLQQSLNNHFEKIELARELVIPITPTKEAQT